MKQKGWILSNKVGSYEGEDMKKLLVYFDYWIFIATTLAIAGVFYEGMELKWFSIVGVFILLMDYSFMVATVIHIWTERKNKWLLLHIFSAAMILTAIVMKLMKIEYPTITLVFWYFYIWFLYGMKIVKCRVDSGKKYEDIGGKYEV